MNLQDHIPSKNSKYNISDKFLRPDRISFIVEYQNILTCDNTITKGITYVLFSGSDSKITMNLVQITDAYWDGYVLSLIFKDMESRRNIHVEFDIFKEPSECAWMLVDLFYLQERIDVLTINNYCGCN